MLKNPHDAEQSLLTANGVVFVLYVGAIALFRETLRMDKGFDVCRSSGRSTRYPFDCLVYY